RNPRYSPASPKSPEQNNPAAIRDGEFGGGKRVSVILVVTQVHHRGPGRRRSHSAAARDQIDRFARATVKKSDAENLLSGRHEKVKRRNTASNRKRKDY